jgi:hypothetical protein
MHYMHFHKDMILRKTVVTVYDRRTGVMCKEDRSCV